MQCCPFRSLLPDAPSIGECMRGGQAKLRITPSGSTKLIVTTSSGNDGTTPTITPIGNGATITTTRSIRQIGDQFAFQQDLRPWGMAASQPQRRPGWNARRLVRFAPRARAGAWRCRIEPKATKTDASVVPASAPTPGAGTTL